MIRLIKMNFYRMIHSKYSYVILLSLVAFISFVAIVTKVEEKAEQSAQGVSTEVENTGDDDLNTAEPDVGIQVQSMDIEKTPTIMDYAVGNLQGGLILVFLTIFITIFVHAEEGSGFVKNIARQSKHKRSIIISKLPAIIAYTIVVLLVYIAITIILMKMLNPDYPLGFSVELLGFIGGETLLAISFASLISFLTTIMRSTALGMTVGMLLATGMGTLITNGIEILIDNAIDVDQYTIIGNIMMLPFEIVTEDYVRAILVGVVWFIVWNVLSVIVVEKRDTI